MMWMVIWSKSILLRYSILKTHRWICLDRLITGKYNQIYIYLFNTKTFNKRDFWIYFLHAKHFDSINLCIWYMLNCDENNRYYDGVIYHKKLFQRSKGIVFSREPSFSSLTLWWSCNKGEWKSAKHKDEACRVGVCVSTHTYRGRGVLVHAVINFKPRDQEAWLLESGCHVCRLLHALYPIVVQSSRCSKWNSTYSSIIFNSTRLVYMGFIITKSMGNFSGYKYYTILYTSVKYYLLYSMYSLNYIYARIFLVFSTFIFYYIRK